MHNKKSRKLKTLLIVIIILIFLFVLFIKSIVITPPKVNETLYNFNTLTLNDSLTTCNNSWLKHNKFDLWELYVKGKPYERGLKTGILTKKLIKEQESAFVNQIDKMIPSRAYLSVLKYIIAFANRNLNKYIPPENLEEIYGISQYASNEFEFIGPAYSRMLNYHAAHDIGHALITYHMVGCTSFAVKNDLSDDSTLLIARNFDFYMGDEFAKNKIIEFVNPDSGYKFMFVTWGGMTGVCSGMNEKGITVTINAGTSEIPYSVRTPISLVARNILQYSSTIQESEQIAHKFKTFVSESILIGSGTENNAVIIEKTPEKQYTYKNNKNYIICTNHFQSDSLIRKKNNIENMLTSSSLYRYYRVKELLLQNKRIDVKKSISILRNVKGLNSTSIGLSNEKAINQLIAHHSIVFKPKQLKVYISTSPYQLGKFLVYDLNKIFNDTFNISKNKTVFNADETIKSDDLLTSKEYKKFCMFKIFKEIIILTTKNKNLGNLSENKILQFKLSNPKYYYTWQLIGDYYYSRKNYLYSAKCYKMAYGCEISNKSDEEYIKKSLVNCVKYLY